MIPLRDVIPSRTFPVVTIGIIAVNSLVFLFQVSLAPRDLAMLVGRFALIPADPDVTTAVTSMFMHGGWLHFIGNMWYLWIFGDNVEDRMGHLRYLGFYLIAGLVAALAHVIASPRSGVPTLGASGAIAGVMGAYFVLYPRSRILTLIPIIVFVEIVEIPAIFFLGFWFVMQLFSGVGSLGAAGQMGGVAFWAHAGGFAAGAGLVFLFRRKERSRVEWWMRE